MVLMRVFLQFLGIIRESKREADRIIVRKRPYTYRRFFQSNTNVRDILCRVRKNV